jgi:hypothetical protein
MLLAAAAFAAEPRSLFDGKTLKGWQQCNGTAKYTVEGGVIVGTTVAGSPNSFLCSEKEYADFELELETKTDPALNSGVQIRSHRYEQPVTVRTFNGREIRNNKQPAGRVYGYQVEISNEESGNSGGVYDEARRGWLDDASSKPECRGAFKDNQWNRYQIRAIGDSIKTFVNGVACADVTDAADLSGFIALQVHSFKGEKPAQVRFRNIRVTELGKHVWRPVWNGKSLDGWTPAGGARWTVEDGALHAVSLPDNDRPSLLTSAESFDKNVTVRVLFKMIKGNSGVFIGWDPEKRKGYEVEVDDTKRTGGYWDAGGKGWTIGPEDNENVIAGEWNELVAHIRDGRLVFRLNGVKTVDHPDAYGYAGRIAVQAHGSKRPTEVWFKDLAVLDKQ